MVSARSPAPGICGCFVERIPSWSVMLFNFQVEYAMEAVKQGSACVGVRSKTHAVLVALKRAHNDMSSYQKKVIWLFMWCIGQCLRPLFTQIFKVDEHVGIAISGRLCFGVCLNIGWRRLLLQDSQQMLGLFASWCGLSVLSITMFMSHLSLFRDLFWWLQTNVR